MQTKDAIEEMSDVKEEKKKISNERSYNYREGTLAKGSLDYFRDEGEQGSALAVKDGNLD